MLNLKLKKLFFNIINKIRNILGTLKRKQNFQSYFLEIKRQSIFLLISLNYNYPKMFEF